MKDEIIQEVWKAKDAIGARFNHDVRALAEHLRRQDKAAPDRVVDLRAKRHADSRTR